jgi:hypothetical protein
MPKLDSATRRLLGEVSEYLQMAKGMSKAPVSKDVLKALEQAEEGIRQSNIPEPLSPGQRDAAGEAGSSALDDVVVPQDEMSPGQREVAELSNAN